MLYQDEHIHPAECMVALHMIEAVAEVAGTAGIVVAVAVVRMVVVAAAAAHTTDMIGRVGSCHIAGVEEAEVGHIPLLAAVHTVIVDRKAAGTTVGIQAEVKELRTMVRQVLVRNTEDVVVGTETGWMTWAGKATEQAEDAFATTDGSTTAACSPAA